MFDEQNQPDYSYNPNNEWEQRHRPMQSTQPESSGFITASLVMGILSLIFLFSGLSPFFGGLGILFAILSRKGQGALPKQAHIGMGLSIGGFTLGILIWIGVCLWALNLIQDPSFREEFLRQYNAYYNGGDTNGNSGIFSGGDDNSSEPYENTPDDSGDSYSDDPNSYYDDYYNDYFGDYYDDYFGDYYDNNEDPFNYSPDNGYNDGYNNGYNDGYDNGGSFNPFRYTPGSGSAPDAPDTMNYGGQT